MLVEHPELHAEGRGFKLDHDGLHMGANWEVLDRLDEGFGQLRHVTQALEDMKA